jgi:alpha-mannosidase
MSEGLIELHIDRVYRDGLLPACSAISAPLAVDRWEAPGEPVPFTEAVANEFEAFAPGTVWGRPWGTTWLRVRGTVPADWPADAQIDLDVDLGFSRAQPGFQAEGLFWSVDGEPLSGVEPRNSSLRLRGVRPGADLDVYVEAASNPDVGSDWTFRPTHLGDLATAGADPIYTFGGARVTLRSPDIDSLERDWFTLRDVSDTLPSTSVRRSRIIAALARAADALNPSDVESSAADARLILRPLLRDAASSATHTVSAVGHAHIDSAWLWPLRETVRKCARTFSNVLDLMER